MQAARKQVAFVVVQVHPVTFAIAPYLAFFALSFTHPAAVAVGLKPILPHIPQVVFVYIALMEVAAYAGASRDAAVAQH